jgi:NADH:ubiquinone oxidoreductase subunit 5 (subunit L)/multisubunit Na+/H+ antiporter MnhA subunit
MTDSYDRATYTNIERKLIIVLDIFFHFKIVTGIAIAAIGASNLSKPETSNNSYSSNASLLKAGYLILLLSVIIIAIYAVVIHHRLRRSSRAERNRQEQSHSTHKVNALVLIHWSMISTVVITARIIYGVVNAFGAKKQIAGFTIQLLLVFGVQFVAASCLIIGGVLSRENRFVLYGEPDEDCNFIAAGK